MKRSTLALAVLATAAAPALAQEVPKLACDPKPEYPGKFASPSQQRVFDRTFKAYDTCIKAYVEERQKAMKAQEVAAQGAVDDYNALVKQMRAESGQEDSSTDKKDGNAPTGARPGYSK